MKLVTFEIRDFKSVRYSTPVEVGDVTCLVGKNESGKTSILQALYKLNPVAGEWARRTELFQTAQPHRTGQLRRRTRGHRLESAAAISQWIFDGSAGGRGGDLVSVSKITKELAQ